MQALCATTITKNKEIDMDYHLEKVIRLNDKTEHESLYSWCLQEFDGNGQQTGHDLIPWEWGFHFTASELRLNQSIAFGELSLLGDEEPEEEQQFEESEIITATLHPGICNDGKWLEDDPRFSMFGTDREIKEFTIRIYKIDKDDSKEHCSIYGGVSYTSEIDFRDETSPDFIEIHLGLSEERFSKLSEIISKNGVDLVRVGISRVSGFYSDWSPSISTNSVKVLTRGSEHEVIKPDGCNIDPPRLGKVGKFDLTLVSRCKLDPKQNLTTINISKLFEDDFEEYEDEIEADEQPDITKLLLAHISRNQAEIEKIKGPLWLLVIVLALILLTLWL
jgi:hypothetical protein